MATTINVTITLGAEDVKNVMMEHHNIDLSDEQAERFMEAHAHYGDLEAMVQEGVWQIGLKDVATFDYDSGYMDNGYPEEYADYDF